MAGIENVEVNTNLLDVISSRLIERRILIEKEMLTYGEAPAGIKEVFELCRGFERAYQSFVNESPVAGKVKEAFMGEKGLSGSVKKAPLEKVFELANVKKVCRYADGYQPHLVSPEHGVRALGYEALDLVCPPVNACVQSVYALLLNAAREAAEKAGEHTESALLGSLPMHVPDFKNVVMPAITAALDEWKVDTERMAAMLVDMEKSYISAGFFRHTMYNRFNRIKQQEAMAMAADKAKAREPGVAGKVKNFFPAFGGAKEPEPQPEAPGDRESATAAPASLSNMSNDPNDFVAAYFDKYGSDEPVGAASKEPPSSWRWQRRFFILSDSQKMLYYFKSPEDVPKPNGLRGQISLADCMVEDVDEKGVPKGPSGAASTSTSDRSQWMMRIRHKDPRQSALKEHVTLLLKAESLQSKLDWLARIKKATGEGRAAPKPAAPKPQESGGDGDPSAAGEGSQGGEGGFSDFGGQGQGQGQGESPNDLSWAKDIEPVQDTHLGEGSRAFRAEGFRDNEGRLLPAPTIILNPLRMMDKAKRPNTSEFEIQYDGMLEQFGADMSIYTRMVCDTICTTVPKAIVHCMIRKSEKNLLEKLFTVIHHLTPSQMELLLKEEDSVVQRRAQAKKAFEDVKSGLFLVQQQLERYNMSSPADRRDKVNLLSSVFAFAGMPEHLSPPQRQYFEKVFSDQYAPDSMRFWTQPPQTKSVLPGQQRREEPRSQAPPPQQQQQQQGPPPGQYRPGPPSGGGGGAPPVPQRAPPNPGQPMRPPPQPGPGAPPPVPQRPAPGAAPQPMGPPLVRRAPPPPPGR